MPPASCRILLLEDEPAIQRVVVTSLENAGFPHVSVSSSIAGARQCWQAQHGKFDIFLTDFSLPDGSALNFIEELVRAKEDLRVVLMTGYSDDVLALDADLEERVTLLEKPFRPRELVELVGIETAEIKKN